MTYTDIHTEMAVERADFSPEFFGNCNSRSIGQCQEIINYMIEY